MSRYDKVAAEQSSGVPWSDLIDRMMESAKNDMPLGHEGMSPDEIATVKAKWMDDPGYRQNKMEVEQAVQRYRLSKKSQISKRDANIIGGELESRGFFERDQEGNVYMLLRDATFQKLT